MKRLNEGAVIDREAAALFHQTIVETHELGVVIILKHQLPRAHSRFLMKKHFGAEVPLKLIQGRADVRVHLDFWRRMPASRAPRGKALDLADR